MPNANLEMNNTPRNLIQLIVFGSKTRVEKRKRLTTYMTQREKEISGHCR